jgi:hypothetical protein
MNDAVKLQRSAQAVTAEVGEEIIFLHEGEGVYFSLDGVGAFVWKNLEAPRTYRELVDLVLEEYDVEEELLRADLTALMAEMVAKGLLLLDPQ